MENYWSLRWHPTWAGRLFGDVLGRLAATPTGDYLLVLDVIAAMLDDRSLLKVAQVEEKCGISARSLHRRFERFVGVSPKWVLSRYRMHDVVTDLDAGYGGCLADKAAKVRLVRPGPLHPRVATSSA